MEKKIITTLQMPEGLRNVAIVEARKRDMSLSAFIRQSVKRNIDNQADKREGVSNGTTNK